MKAEAKKVPPNNAKRIWRATDLPPHREVARYKVYRSDGTETFCSLSKRRCQVMDLLLSGPVFCASPVRISDMVHVLKSEVGIEVETEYYPGSKESGSGPYGVYFLKSKVYRLAQGVPA